MDVLIVIKLKKKNRKIFELNSILNVNIFWKDMVFLVFL